MAEIAEKPPLRQIRRPGPEVGRGAVLERFGMFWNSFRLEFLIFPDSDFGMFWNVLECFLERESA